MKTLKYAILLLSFIASTSIFAKSPHESDSLISNDIIVGKVIAAEANFLSSEVNRLTKKLEKTLNALPLDISHHEGKIISVLVDQVENNLESIKKDIDALSYQKSSNSLYILLEQVEQDIDMI